MSARLIHVGAVAAISVISLASTARADEKAACIASAETGQDLRSEGKLRTARDRFVECSRATCPDAIRKDCARFLEEIEKSLPSIVITAVDSAGVDVAEAKAFLDGAPTPLDGKAVFVDPGKHEVRIEPKSGAAVRAELVVSEGEKNRKVQVTVASPASKPSVAPVAPMVAGSPPIAAYVIGGAGLLVLGGSLYLGFATRGELSDMRSSCAPYCDSSDVDAKKRALLFADIGVGVGAIAIGAAAYMIAFPSARSAPPSVGAAYLPSGGMIQWSSVF